MKKLSNINKRNKVTLSIVLLAILVTSSSYIIYASGYFEGVVRVNEKKLPELESMHVIETKKIKNRVDDYGVIYEENLSEHRKFQNEMSLSLLNSELSNDNPYVIEKIQTDNEDYAILTFDNYIIGDTYDYIYDHKEGFYNYRKGEEYYSPISLKVDVILSEEQMKNGWDTEYLGMYQFEEQYISKQGYKVNIMKETVKVNDTKEYISEKYAMFVVDGIRYTLKGRTSLENLKLIVDTMKY